MVKDKSESDIAEALAATDKEAHPVGPQDLHVYRIKVFLRAEVPLNKFDRFHEFLEKNASCLSDRRPMAAIVPFMFFHRSRHASGRSFIARTFRSFLMACEKQWVLL